MSNFTSQPHTTAVAFQTALESQLTSSGLLSASEVREAMRDVTAALRGQLTIVELANVIANAIVFGRALGYDTPTADTPSTLTSDGLRNY